MYSKPKYKIASYLDRSTIEQVKREINSSKYSHRYWVTFTFDPYCDPKSYEKAKAKLSGFQIYLARRFKCELIFYCGYADQYSAEEKQTHFHAVILSNKAIPLSAFNEWKYGRSTSDAYVPELDGVGYIYENHIREDIKIVCGVAKHRKWDSHLRRKVLCCPFREQPSLAGVGSIQIGSCAS